MKKLLAISLSLAMMLSMLSVSAVTPEAVSIPESGETYIEGEAYQDFKVYTGTSASDAAYHSTIEATGRTKADANAHGGAFGIINGVGAVEGSTVQKVEIEVPVNVEKAGAYFIAFSAHIPSTYTCSTPNLKLDGEKIITVGTDVNSPVTAANAEFNITEVKLDLTAGSHTFTFESFKAGAGTQVYAWWDFIRVSKFSIDTPEVPSTGEIYIEAENYPDVKVYDAADATEPVDTVTQTGRIKADSAAHGGQFWSAFAHDLVTSITAQKGEIDIPIKVAKAGRYFLAFSAHRPGQYTCTTPKLY